MPKPTVIVAANHKGGVGKSTLTCNLAVEAGRAGQGPVAMLDTDPQGTSVAWWNVREAETPIFAQIEQGNLALALTAIEESGVQTVLIDTPPSVTDEIAKVLSYADMVVIPVRPSPNDLRAVGRTVDLVKAAGKPFVFVITQAKQGALLTLQAMAALSDFGPVSAIIVHDRVDYAGSMIDGRTVVENDPKSRSAAEVIDLWKDIRLRLKAKPQDRIEAEAEPSLNYTQTGKGAAA